MVDRSLTGVVDRETLAHISQEARRPHLEETTSKPLSPDLYSYLNRFSNINKIYRFLARCLRWRVIASRKETANQFVGFSVALWAIARRPFFYVVQQHHFSSEISSCQNHRAISRNSPMIRLTPFQSDDQLLRVGGRLAHAALPFNEKHPIILPRCELVRRLIEYVHQVTSHGGPQVMRSFFMQILLDRRRHSSSSICLQKMCRLCASF